MLSKKEYYLNNPMKKINPIFSGKIENGKIVLDTPALRKRFQKRLIQLEGRKIHLSVNPFNKKRTLKQNNFYWGAILPMIANQTGMIEEELHIALSMMFLKDETKLIPTIRSTRELDKNDFGEYLEKIQDWCRSFLNITDWPNPEEYELREIYD